MKRQVIGSKAKISLDVHWEVLSLNSVKKSMKDKTTLDYLFRENFLPGSKEKAMAPHSSTLAWKIPRTEEPGGLQSMGS